MQLARIIGGIASGGHLVRPHVVFPDQLPDSFRKGLLDNFPGTGDAYVPIDPANWTIITDGMYNVTQPGLYHTAGAEGLPGIDFAGKTGTAQQMSHEALGKTNKGRSTFPNVWFVGVTPRRNPELVVAVLWQNGEFSYYPARIGAQVVAAFVDKKRRLANNLPPPKAAPAPAPVEVGAVWTVPDAKAGANNAGASKLQSGHFYVDSHGIVAADSPAAKPAPKAAAVRTASAPAAGSAAPLSPAQVAAAMPVRRKEP
jgi:penicillin-binding protein 2